MGIIKRGILGGFSNKVANVVGSSWKGIAVIKSLPLSVANPKTAGQVTQRSVFSQASKMGSILLASIIKPLWDRFAQQASGYNDWVRTNIGYFTQAGVTDFANLVMSKGTLALDAILGFVGSAGASNLSIVWDEGTGGDSGLSTDIAIACAYNATKDEWGFSNTTTTRADEEIFIPMPTPVASSDELHGYLMFKRPDGSIVSNSSYSSLTIA